MQDQSIVFIHIPKTAGSTFVRQIIPNQYKRESVFETEFPFPKSYREFITMGKREKESFRVIQGHMGFGLHDYIPQKVKYVTFLREPVERVISLYCYIQRRAYPRCFYNETEHKQNEWKDKSLKEVINSGSFKELENGQTRRLAGTEGNIYTGECTRDTLEIAKDNLRNYFLVAGTTDDFNRGILHLKHLLGWQNVCYLRINVNREKLKNIGKLSKEDIEAVRLSNQLDVELYQFVKQQFKIAVASHEYLTERKVKYFNFYNSKVFPVLYKLEEIVKVFHRFH